MPLGCEKGLRGPGARPSGILVFILFLAFPLWGASPPPPAGVPHFLQVNEHIYRSGQPGKEGLKSLATIGVRAVIDLRAAGSRSSREEQAVETLGMKYYNVPLPGLAAPPEQRVAIILALLDDSNNWPVLIHCRRGKDRTGTIIACYRIEHDRWPNNRALAEAIDDGLNGVERGMKDYIRQYKPPAPKTVAKARAQ